MAKGKYAEWLSKEGLLKLEAWARDGLNDEQISKNLGIKPSTLYEWKNKYPEISEALKRGKEIVDIEVENTLLSKALGFKESVIKAFKVKNIIYDDGKKVSEKEEIIYANEEVYIPPDTTSIIFWLKNRKPDTWRDKKDVEMSGEVNNPLAGLTTEELKKLISND